MLLSAILKCWWLCPRSGITKPDSCCGRVKPSDMDPIDFWRDTDSDTGATGRDLHIRWWRSISCCLANLLWQKGQEMCQSSLLWCARLCFRWYERTPEWIVSNRHITPFTVGWLHTRNLALSECFWMRCRRSVLLDLKDLLHPGSLHTSISECSCKHNKESEKPNSRLAPHFNWYRRHSQRQTALQSYTHYMYQKTSVINPLVAPRIENNGSALYKTSTWNSP